ncbi:tetratricopeptide repeat protein, partial [Sulfurimonas sp. SAG-AH-194-C21]
ELKNRSTNLIVSLLLMSIGMQSKAAILDFYHISNAEDSFEAKKYANALVSYEKLTQTQRVLYNTANTQYKLELYDRAIKNYIKSLSKDDIFNAKIYYNIANAYVRQGKLHLAKKYYKKSLSLTTDTEAQENLNQIQHILANQKHKIAKDKEEKYKLPQRISIERKSPQDTLSSDYVVRLEKIVLSEEEKILRALKKQKPIIYLRKLDTHKRSTNVLQD